VRPEKYFCMHLIHMDNLNFGRTQQWWLFHDELPPRSKPRTASLLLPLLLCHSSSRNALSGRSWWGDHRMWRKSQMPFKPPAISSFSALPTPTPHTPQLALLLAHPPYNWQPQPLWPHQGSPPSFPSTSNMPRPLNHPWYPLPPLQ
jgi:hypothetical protein